MIINLYFTFFYFNSKTRFCSKKYNFRTIKHELTFNTHELKIKLKYKIKNISREITRMF